MIARLARSLAFARHIPPAKLLWRARLTAQRRLALRRPPDLGDAAPRTAAHPPEPVFPPRTGKVERLDDGWRFTFVGHAEAMGAQVDWMRHGPAGRDQLWRMNLHYMEYLETLDQSDGLALIRQWVAANPPFAPGFWHDSWNSYALSLRVVCWMQFLARTGQSGRHPDVEASLARQLRFLEANLERDLGGNHLVKNIKALLWASAYFTGDEAERWRRTGERLMRRELAAQTLADGVHCELSPSYHAQVMADWVECRHAIGAGTRLDGVIARMARATADLSHPDGSPALFNDAGLTMAYPPAECVAAARLAMSPAPRFNYPQAGYFGAHYPEWSVIADMGRIGADDLPAHAHGDVGGFELSVAGRRMIVDQGVFEYVNGERRRVSRSAASHASLAIEGAEQADFFGAFRCGRRPGVEAEWQETKDGFTLEGHHDGYRNLPGRPVPVRRFTATADELRIDDRIEGRTDRRVSMGLLLHPDCAIEIDGNRARIVAGAARLDLEASLPFAVEPAIWWPDMGQQVETRRLRLTWGVACSEAWLRLRPHRMADRERA